MDYAISAADRERLERLAGIGRSEFRPAGLRADRAGSPLPPDDPFFERMLALGFGRTSWKPPGASDADTRAPNKAGSAVAGVLMAEESAYWDRGIGVAMCGPGLGESPVLGMGTPEQKARFLSPFVAPEKPIWGAFAMSEPSGGSDVANIRTRARKDGDHWVLDGAKAWSGNAHRAEWTVVWATIDPSLGRGGHRAFVVERGTPGFEGHRIEKKMGLRAYESVSFFLNECRVPAGNLLGGEAYYASRAGFKGAMNTFNAGRPAIGGMAVGIGRAALDESVRFAKETGLWSRQRVRDRIERSRRKLKSAMLLALRAAWMADQRVPNAVEASMAKAVAPTVALEACAIGMELLGLVGGRGDHLIEKLHRDVKALDIVEGTGQIQRIVMARGLVNLPN
ncbi:MAG: hypothetical protein RIS35_105 [Pseudomonadota bacterium]|jgi:acyl-CoA dehydrogenase